MYRRTVLLALGSASSIGAMGLSVRSPDRRIEVKIWLSERASAYPTARDRAADVLAAAFGAAGIATEITYADDPVRLPAESGRAVLGNRWPHMVLLGRAGYGEIAPVSDVNLLVTDGPAYAKHAGFGTHNVAAVCGARHLADLPSVASIDDPVPYTAAHAMLQLVLHECGHAVGLTHEHGRVDVDGGIAVASPMMGGYAWRPGLRGSGGDDLLEATCGGDGARPTATGRRLSLSYSACARGAIRGYRGGALP